MKRAIQLVAGILVLAVVVMFIRNVISEDDKTFTAQFENTAGLFVGNDVGVLGVRVGEITSIEPRGDHVEVTLRVDSDIDIPADANALIVPRSVATDRYIELAPAYTSGPTLEDGAVLSMNRTRIPVEFDELLESANHIAEGLIGTDAASSLGDLIDGLAVTFEGNGEALGSALDGMAQVLESIDVDDVTDVIRNLQVLASAVVANEETINAFLNHVSSASQLLSEEADGFIAAVDSTAEFLEVLDAFIDEYQDDLVQQVADYGNFVGTLVTHEVDFTNLLRGMPLMMQNVQRAIVDDRLVIRIEPEALVINLYVSLCEDVLGEGPFCDALGEVGNTIADIIGGLFGNLEIPRIGLGN